jgi:hypothetical protein
MFPSGNLLLLVEQEHIAYVKYIFPSLGGLIVAANLSLEMVQSQGSERLAT